MTPDEYLEKTFSESFKRELDADENVARTLPFFAATVALAVNVFGYVGTQLHSLRMDAVGIAIYLLLGVGGICLAGTLWWLLVAVWPRYYRIPARETEFQDWAQELRKFYVAGGLSGAALDDAITADLRGRMIDEFAQATVHNRTNNARKNLARTQGLTLAVSALAIAFFAAGTMFVRERIFAPVGEDTGHAETTRRSTQAGGQSGAATDDGGVPSAEACAPKITVSCGRGENPRGSSIGASEVMTENTKSPGANTPQQQPPAPAKPAAPAPQMMKKSDSPASGPLNRR